MEEKQRPLILFRIDQFDQFYEKNQNDEYEMKLLYMELLTRKLNRMQNNKPISKKFNQILEILAESISFRWPSSEIDLKNDDAKSEFKKIKRPKSLLASYGYEVGQKGKSFKDRIVILSNIYEHEIFESVKKQHDSMYIEEFGKPRTGKRLKKIADIISSNIKNRKRMNDKDYSQAIIEWEQDLKKIKSLYYDGVYDKVFIFPDTI